MTATTVTASPDARLPLLVRPGRKLIILLVLTAAAVVPPVLGRADALDEVWASSLTVAVTYTAMALSLNLLMGYAGQISLGHAAFVAVGAYASGILTGRYGLAFFVGVVVAAAFGAVVAFVVGLPALRLRGLYLAITTLGLLLVMQASVLQIPWLSRGSAGVELPRPVAGTFVFSRNADYLALALVLLVGLWLLDRNLLASRYGRAFLGLREDEQVAQSFGVDVARAKLLAFVLSGAMAGVAGAMHGHLRMFVDSRTFDLNLSLLLVAIVVIGGLGYRIGVAIAAVAFGLSPEFLRELSEAVSWLDNLHLVIGSFLLIVTMAENPAGFAGAIAEARHARAAKRARAGSDDDVLDTSVPPLPDLPRPTGLPLRDGVPDGAPMLEVTGVTVRFGGLTAVDDASLTVPAGRIVGLIGPNGAGKSTLFNAVSGFVRPEQGSFRFLGTELSGLAPHERAAQGIGRTFQSLGLARNLSVRDNLLLAQHPLAGYGAVRALLRTRRAERTERELRARAEEAIAALGFEAFADTPVKHLSGGQQRIVEMACALVTAPELLMLDEPSAGMAPAAVESLAARLRDVRDELGRTILLIEHNIPLVLDVCDEVYVLDSGRILAHGDPDHVARHPQVIEAYLGSAAELEGVGA